MARESKNVPTTEKGIPFWSRWASGMTKLCPNENQAAWTPNKMHGGGLMAGSARNAQKLVS